VFPDVLALLEDSRKFDPDYQKFAAYYDERLRQNTLTPRERVIDTLNQK
jgi:hypothetical protein